MKADYLFNLHILGFKHIYNVIHNCLRHHKSIKGKNFFSLYRKLFICFGQTIHLVLHRITMYPLQKKEKQKTTWIEKVINCKYSNYKRGGVCGSRQDMSDILLGKYCIKVTG